METGRGVKAAGSQAAWSAPDVIPSFSYQDAKAAINFLEKAFGFEVHAVYEGEGGTIDHAELRFGNGMIMLGTAHDRPDWPTRAPGQLGGTTGGTYVIVADPDAHFARARAAGAEIVRGLVDQDYGGRDYGARDPEGYLWSFGTYRPTAG
ncbi:MAG: VOC family protein [Candidatus Dormibacter sp.]|uniref:VOC family protein n=1 Tax=Candidatus Dormibacter sp. TaxID=2973982 RepID=UPI000DB54F59|nr:MAG: hypothetical protein DLM66_06045 [Candidatus Dormibacteraeota bacterium]